MLRSASWQKLFLFSVMLEICSIEWPQIYEISFFRICSKNFLIIGRHKAQFRSIRGTLCSYNDSSWSHSMIQFLLVIQRNTFFPHYFFEKIEPYLPVTRYEQYLHINKALLETLKKNLTKIYIFQRTLNLSLVLVCPNTKNY